MLSKSPKLCLRIWLEKYIYYLKIHILLYPYSRHPLQAQAPLNLSVMTCHSLESLEFYACPRI